MRENFVALLATVAAATASAAVDPDHAATRTESRTLFVEQVRELLQEHCVRCHGGEKTKSDFDLASRESLLAGGAHGSGIVVGKSSESLLYQAVAHLDEDLAMPPKKPQLAADEIAAIAKWIDLGAVYDKPLVEDAVDPDAPMRVTAADRAYWAYAPLADPQPPAPDNWGANPIDGFIAARHRAEGLVPAAPVEKSALIRRAFFDLIGLPPTPAELAAFVANPDPAAYEHLLDDLLARPGYGERWARHWLDVARFAESHGFEHDYDRNHAFHFRDFVIRALNADMPYDQFVRWQIAGDELAPDRSDAMAATGFLGAGVYPTQITLSEAERVRFDATDDMIATMGSAMLATTIGCARCHDHKYDPIPARDYYELLSAFTTTVRSEIELETQHPDPAAVAAWEEKQAALTDQLEMYRREEIPGKLEAWLAARHNTTADENFPAAWQVLEASSLTAEKGTTFQHQPDGSYLANGPNPDFDVFTFAAPSPIDSIRAIRLEAFPHDSMVKGGPGRAANGNFALTDLRVSANEMQLVLRNPRATFNQNPSLHVSHTIDDDPRSAWAIDPQFGKRHAAIYEVENAAHSEELTVTLRFENNKQHTMGRFRLSVSARPASSLPLTGDAEHPAATAVRELLAMAQTLDGAPSPQVREKLTGLYLQIDDGWAELQTALAKHNDVKPVGKKETVMVCSEGFKPMRHHTNSGKVPDFYEESYYLLRGDPDQKDGLAPLGFLQVLIRDNASPERWKVEPEPAARTSLKRSAVARWLTDVEAGAGHLLARVIVNRLWQHHFGRGIVATPNDFGLQGERPTHPELLDYLARDLIENGWQLKRLHKKIMMSSSYALGSSNRPENLRADPENQLWWKREPRRLEAEIIRDNALAASGLLDRSMFGPGSLDPNMKRRSIYFFVKRSKLVPMMQLYDWPDTMTSLGRRSVTITPSQALIFLNSPQVREMAKHFAASLANEEDPVGAALLRTHGRDATPPEREAVDAFLGAQTATYNGDTNAALVDFCHALLASNEMIYVK